MNPPSVPLPTGDVWVQFPIIAVIVACFVIAFVGLFFFVKWAWSAYQKNKEADLAWREAQNEKRELAQNARDEKMTGFFITVSAGNAVDINDMRQVSTQIIKALDTLVLSYNGHDLQAKAIAATVAEIRDLVNQLKPGQQAASANVRTRPRKE